MSGASVRFEYHRPGRGVTTYHERLVLERPEVAVLLLETSRGYQVAGTPVLDPGAPMLWFVFPDGWASVARFHLADGTFTGWYTNLCTPVEKRGNLWSSTDLFLDLWTPATGAARWLDEDQLESAATAGLLDAQLRARVEDERARIERLLVADAWPPALCRSFDLGAARAAAR